MKKIVLVALLIFFIGCAGTPFSIIPEEQLPLGQVTTESITKKLGKPYNKATMVKNGQLINKLTFGYAKVTMDSLFGGVTPAVAQTFYFHNNRLVGHVYSKSGAGTTNFNELLIRRIKKGQTTVPEVNQLLGTPSGKYGYPLIEDPDDQALVYLYGEVQAGVAFQKYLIVSYDPKGVVTKVDYFQNEGRI